MNKHSIVVAVNPRHAGTGRKDPIPIIFYQSDPPVGVEGFCQMFSLMNMSAGTRVWSGISALPSQAAVI